jgi:hypothetical protein
MKIMRTIKKICIWTLGGAAIVVAAGTVPVVYTETVCRADATPQAAAAIFTDPADQRPEARTFLVYPEWHVVYAYEELAATLQDGPAYTFDYGQSIAGFWTSLCALRAETDRIGDPGEDAMLTIYTVGLSFTLEMIAKAAYEETIGRLAAAVGGSDTPQDDIEREMAQVYGTFLHQTPWYLFDFDTWTEKLQAAPTNGLVRSWERRIALTGEWRAKSAYAGVIAKAVEGMEPDALTMKIHVTGLDTTKGGEPTALSSIPVIGGISGGDILEVDRYRVFTRTAQEIAAQGGTITEIAGNDDIMVSVTGSGTPALDAPAKILRTTPRVGMTSDRTLIHTKISSLADLIRQIEASPFTLEHIYDY